MEIYVLIEHSSGEEKLSLDSLQVFSSFEKASEALKEKYKNIIVDIYKYGKITEAELQDEYYYIVLEENGFETVYRGLIQKTAIN